MKINLFVPVLVLVSAIFVTSCSKDNESDPTLPEISDVAANPVLVRATSVKVNGFVKSDGNAKITGRGACWSTSENPTINDSKVESGTGSGIFMTDITGLEQNTEYHVRVYATNKIGTAYGRQITFITATLPTVTTTAASSITSTSASVGGEVTITGNEEVEVYGIYYWKDGAANNKFTREGSGSGSFTSQLSGLEPATAYKAQAYATTKIQDTAMGEIISFTTLSE